MVQALSVDLSRRQAADWFGVSAASAIRWEQLVMLPRDAEATAEGWRSTVGRDRAQEGLILDAYAETPDITLAEWQALLADHGTKVAQRI